MIMPNESSSVVGEVRILCVINKSVTFCMNNLVKEQ